jgi:hypothetical protein
MDTLCFAGDYPPTEAIWRGGGGGGLERGLPSSHQRGDWWAESGGEAYPLLARELRDPGELIIHIHILQSTSIISLSYQSNRSPYCPLFQCILSKLCCL